MALPATNQIRDKFKNLTKAYFAKALAGYGYTNLKIRLGSVDFLEFGSDLPTIYIVNETAESYGRPEALLHKGGESFISHFTGTARVSVFSDIQQTFVSDEICLLFAGLLGHPALKTPDDISILEFSELQSDIHFLPDQRGLYECSLVFKWSAVFDRKEIPIPFVTGEEALTANKIEIIFNALDQPEKEGYNPRTLWPPFPKKDSETDEQYKARLDEFARQILLKRGQ